jgi:hypothetical protein
MLETTWMAQCTFSAGRTDPRKAILTSRSLAIRGSNGLRSKAAITSTSSKTIKRPTTASCASLSSKTASRRGTIPSPFPSSSPPTSLPASAVMSATTSATKSQPLCSSLTKKAKVKNSLGNCTSANTCMAYPRAYRERALVRLSAVAVSVLVEKFISRWRLMSSIYRGIRVLRFKGRLTQRPVRQASEASRCC